MSRQAASEVLSALKAVFSLQSSVFRLALAAGMMTAGTAMAETITWNGGTSGSWGNTANWTPGVLPNSKTSDVVFCASGAGNLTNTYIRDDRTIRSLTFNANAVTNTGDVLIRLDDGGTIARTLTNDTDEVGGNATITVNSDATGNYQIGIGSRGSIVLNDNLLVTHNGSGTLTIGRPVSSSGNYGVTKDGTGVLILGAACTYSNTTTITAGTLRLGGGSDRIPDGAGKGDVSMGAAGTLDLGGYNDTINGLGGAGTVTNSSATAATLTAGNNDASGSFSGVIVQGAGSIALTKVGTGTLTLSGVNTYDGATTVSNGTLALSGSGTIGTNTLTLAGGATFDVSGRGGYTLDANQRLVLSGAGATATNKTAASNGLTMGASGVLEFSAYDGVTPPLTVTGAGNLTLAGNAVSLTAAPACLAPGDHILISGGKLSGTVGALTHNISPAAGHGDITLAITGGNLVLTVAQTSGWNLPATGGSYAYPTNIAGINYGVHVYTNTGATYGFFPLQNLDVEYLVVAGGGGGGGHRAGGGGGAGGMLTGTVAVTVSGGVRAVVVGAGGKGVGASANDAASGNNSSFNPGSIIEATGGGNGASYSGNQSTSIGGSGGAGTGGTGADTTGSSGTGGQGYAGGDGYSPGGSGETGGGGGGAFEAGVTPVTQSGGAGGRGVTNWITGAAVVYATGGNGRSRTTQAGNGASVPDATGNGGNAGAGLATATGSAGGSGIVVIRYVMPISVSVTAPTNTQAFAHNASIAVTAVVEQAGSGLGVEFFTDTNGVSYTSAGTGTSPTSTVTLTGPFTPGTYYHIYAVATNDKPSTATSSTNTFTVLLAPSVTVTSPTNNQSYANNSTITATATVTNGVGPFWVTYYTNGVLAGSNNTASTYPLNLGSWTTGGYKIHAVVNDSGNGGEAATSTTNDFTVLGAALGVTLNVPTNGAEFAFDISIAATTTVNDASGPTTNVTFYTNFNGGTFGSAGTVSSAPYALNLGQLPPGTNGIFATVTDGSGSATSATHTITVLAAPTVTLAALEATYEYGVSITATATCANGKSPYNSLLFYTNNALEGTYGSAGGTLNGTTSTVTFATLFPGTYYIYAEVTDSYSDTARTVTNNFTVVDSFSPTVTGVTASPTNVSDATVGAKTFAVTVTFDQAMKTSVAPTLVFNPAVDGTTLTNAVGGWSNSLTYTSRYDVADANTTAAGVTIDVEGAQDVNGNGQTDYGPLPEFSIDTENPTVTLVSVNDSALDVSDIGVGKFVVTVTFSEAMTTNGTADPTLTFTPAVGSALSGLVGGWPNSTTYTARYDVSGSPTALSGITIGVAGAKDAIGNTNVIYTSAGLFSVSAAPWAYGGSGGNVTNYTDLVTGKKWTAHIFTNVGASNITFSSAGIVEYLVVAGGGSGAGDIYGNGGGGAGGMLTGTVYVTAGSYVITNGAGGVGSVDSEGRYGYPSSFDGIMAKGGGRGTASDNGAVEQPGGNGGSGGGGGKLAGGLGEAGPPRQGNDGWKGNGNNYGGGGGGAGETGAINTERSTGGKGLTNSITGVAVVYARGGNGATRNGNFDGADGGDNTGQGGGGASNSGNPPSYRGGHGGSGIVVIRYRTPLPGTVILLR